MDADNFDKTRVAGLRFSRTIGLLVLAELRVAFFGLHSILNNNSAKNVDSKTVAQDLLNEDIDI